MQKSLSAFPLPANSSPDDAARVFIMKIKKCAKNKKNAVSKNTIRD